MKRVSQLAGVLLVGMFVFTGVAAAHPPSALTVSYKADEGLLKIEISHPVGNVSDHYVEDVDVEVDGEDVADLSYSGQMDRQGQMVLVTIGHFNEGANLKVEADCNKFGDLEFTGKVPPARPGEFAGLE
jgi:hypothetical protein